MNTTGIMSDTTQNDAELVARSLAGDQEAFAAVVERYQSLVCSLAYSATGSLGRSEEIAQETFVTAWKQLRRLREPASLRSWLCGIARNLTRNALRRQKREVLDTAQPLESAAETAAPTALPSQEAITRDEEAILWRALDQIPETYREPLILFYREHQSVQTLAESLDITQDAARQRLSRGRRLLNDKVTAFVEGALERSAPGKAFTVGVIAALPVLATSASASAATLGAAAIKGSTAAKVAVAGGLLGAIVGPIIGILGGWFGVKASLANATSERERRLIIRFSWTVAGLVLVSLAFMGGFVSLGRRWFETRPALAAGTMIGFAVLYCVALLALILRFNILQRRIRREDQANRPEAARPVASFPPVHTVEYKTRHGLLGIPWVHVLVGRRPEDRMRPALGWIAIGDVSVGVLFSFGGIALGGISIGGMSAGLLAFGGLALAPFVGGGLGIGFWAVGGCAVGWLAVGGCALAWRAAVGGVAVARHIALGGSAVARHANDEVARAFVEGHPFFEHARESIAYANWFVILCLLPLGFIVWHGFQARKRLAQADRPTA